MARNRFDDHDDSDYEQKSKDRKRAIKDRRNAKVASRDSAYAVSGLPDENNMEDDDGNDDYS